MATETYTTVYIADASAFVAGSRQVLQSLAAVDLAVARTKANLTGFGAGGGRSAAAAAKNVDKLIASLNGVPGAANAAKNSLNGFNASAGGAAGGGRAMADAWRLAAEAVRIFSKAAEDAKRHLNQGAEAGTEKRDKARDYATLLNKNEVDDETMKRLFTLAQAGGSTYDGALKFGREFLGSIESGEKKGHINKVDRNAQGEDQKTILEREGLAFGNRIGLDEGTAGDLVGVIPQSVDMTKDERGNPLTVEQGVDKAMGQLAALTAGLQDGRGNISTLAKSELAFAVPALATGHVKDHAEAGAFAGTASTFTKTASSSGTATKQMDRLINESLGDEGEWLKAIGVADAKGDYNKLGKLKAHLDAQRKASADPSRFDAKSYLQSKGFKNDTELDATVAFVENYDVLTKQIQKGVAASKNGAGARQANRQFLASQSGQSRQARAIQEAGNYEQTRRRQRLSDARKAAYGQLMAENKIDTLGTNLTDGFLDATVNNLHTNTEHEARIDQRVWENARKAAKQAGIEKEVDAADQRYLDPSGKGESRYVEGSGPLGIKELGTYVAPYGGQDPAKLDEFLNRFGPEIGDRKVPINGSTVDVGVNPEQSKIQAQRAAAGANPAPAAGVAPAAGPAANPAAAGGNKVASVDTSKLEKVAEQLGQVAQLQMRAANAQLRSMNLPGADLGGSYGPQRA